MPSYRQIADELLLGLAYETRDIIHFSDDLEPLNDDAKTELGNPDAFTNVRSYREFLDLNGGMVHRESPDCWEERDSISENLDDDYWSMDVNLDSEDLRSKRGRSFLSFVDWIVAKLSLGRKLRFGVHRSALVLRMLCGLS